MYIKSITELLYKWNNLKKRFISWAEAELKLLIIQYNLFYKLGEFVRQIKRDDPN